jgi:uncharacterized membrane protein
MKIIVLAAILLTSFSGYAQNIDIPQKEFALSLESESITLARGENKKIEVRILKSKSYQKSKVQLGLSSGLPSGLTLSFDPAKGNVDAATATVTASSEATPGEYTVIVNATMNYKTKGSILKIVVN